MSSSPIVSNLWEARFTNSLVFGGPDGGRERRMDMRYPMCVALDIARMNREKEEAMLAGDSDLAALVQKAKVEAYRQDYMGSLDMIHGLAEGVSFGGSYYSLHGIIAATSMPIRSGSGVHEAFAALGVDGDNPFDSAHQVVVSFKKSVGLAPLTTIVYLPSPPSLGSPIMSAATIEAYKGGPKLHRLGNLLLDMRAVLGVGLTDGMNLDTYHELLGGL